MSSPSERKRDDDFSEKHVLPVSQKGAQEKLRDLQDEVYDVIKEVIQNALDSRDRGLPNEVIVTIPENPKRDEPVLEVTDKPGDGITKDYGGNLDKFLEAQKATSEKTNRLGTVGNKGIGMFQYTHIGRNVIITSIDKHPRTGEPEMIYRIPLYLTEDGWTAFGLTHRKPATEEYMKEFGLDHPGTRVAFFDRDPEADVIDAKELRKVLKNQYTILLAERPEVDVIINNDRLELPKWIRDHPPRFIQRMSGATKPEEYDRYDIRGAVWADENGSGEIKLYVDGNLVQTFIFQARQCAGYLNLNLLKVTSARNKIIQDKAWREFKEKVLRLISQFPKVRNDKEDKSLPKSVHQMMNVMLGKLIPPVPCNPANKKSTKIDGTGDPEGFGTIGYRTTTEPPDPNREKETRIFRGRDKANQTQVSPEGKIAVKKASDDPSNRNEAPDFEDVRTGRGDKKPLFELIMTTKPVQMITNTDNEEYLPLKAATTKPMRACILYTHMSEISEGLSEETRMKLSEARVRMMRALGLYPKKKSALEIEQQRKDTWA